MIVTFAEAYLRDLYEKGVSSDKKHRYQPAVIKSYKKGIEFLKVASRKEDLFPVKSLNFEALQGEKAGLFSIRAGLKYRIEFSMTETEEQPILTICNILDLSNHYE